MKLLTKYSRISILIMLVFFVTATIVYYFLMNYILLKELDESLVRTENHIKKYVKEYNILPTQFPMDDLYINYKEKDTAVKQTVFKLISPAQNIHLQKHSLRQLIFYVVLKNRNYEVIVEKNLEGTKTLTKLIVKTLVVAILLLILIYLFVNRFVFYKLWRPFYDSLDALSNFTLGKNKKINFTPSTTDEFIFMNDKLLKMAERMDKEFVVLKEFTENASHEMQTPLAIIRSKLDLAIQDENLSENQTVILKGAYTGLKKLSNLNKSLLLITKIENNQFADNKNINLKTKVQDKIEQFHELWNNKLIITSKLTDTFISANSDLIDILLNNLFSNASKHNIENGNVCVELNNSFFTITNTGKNYPLDENRLFKRFYKASVDNDNNGLGLSIIKQICDISNINVSYSFANSLHSFTMKWANGTRRDV